MATRTMATVAPEAADLADLSPFEAGLALLGEVFGKEITPVLANAYRRALRALPEAAFARAVDRLLQTEEFFPKPGAIIAAAVAAMTPEEREVHEAIGLTRSWLAGGALPLTYSPARLVATRRFLGLPDPTEAELAALAAERARRGLTDDPDAAPGPLEAFIAGGGRTIGMVGAGGPRRLAAGGGR